MRLSISPAASSLAARAAGAALVFWALTSSQARASEVVRVAPLTDRTLMVHFRDGRVIHHRRGQPRTAEKVVADPLPEALASLPSSYRFAPSDGSSPAKPSAPAKVSRKSKGTDFAWFVDSWEEGRAVNRRPDHVKEHWIYLALRQPMRPGRRYTLDTGPLASNGRRWTVRFDPTRTRSEAVHVNTLGYVPTAPAKYAYVYHWMGDGGSLDLEGSRAFFLVDQLTSKRVFSGRVRLRKPRRNPETFHTSDSPPHGNFLGADVWEADFSAFRRPGRYVVAVDGVGCSWPFRIAADVYRPAFGAVARALYHNRSGIELRKPFTAFPRPAPHNSRLTPGFAGKLRYTRVRWPEWGSEGGDAERLMAESPGALSDTWGWYQDAGDWDGYYSHLRVAQELLFVFEMRPRNFADGELNLPESGNGVPDLLDEAAWLPRYCHRLRHELMKRGWGTGGLGLRVSGDAFGGDEKVLPDGSRVGQGSWEDVDRVWMVSGEDPWSTYRYAGAAAHLALCARIAGVKRDPGGVDWAKEAREAYAWAEAHSRPGDEAAMDGLLKHPRAYAAASLFRLTGERRYEDRFRADTAWVTPDTLLWDEAAYGPFAYALGGSRGTPRADLHARIRAAILRTADESLVTTASKRALRWGGNWFMPMLVGHQTTPWVLEGAIGYTLTRKSEPARARRYLEGLYTTADYFLGTNALNQTWITGVGPRYPAQVFHMDAWYNGTGRFHPGLIPYGPWRKEKDRGQGPWDSDWANSTVYPPIDVWPGGERWFSNRCSPLTSEFTIHQNLGPAAIYGFLCAPSPSRGSRSSSPPRGGTGPSAG